MENVFFHLLDMSATGSFIILAVILLRFVFRKAPKWLVCVLWVIVAVRLVCPISLESEISVLPRSDNIQYKITQDTDATLLDTSPGYEDNITLPPVSPAVPIEPSGTIELAGKKMLYSAIPWIWFGGVTAMLTYMAISYLRVKHRVRVSEPIGGGVYICDNISSSFILGFIRPKIYIPSDMPFCDVEYVVSHENAHIKRQDHWWKPLGFMILSVYWFNPLLWIAYFLLCRDIEYACDECVIKNTGIEYRTGYAVVLLRNSAPRRLISACPLAFSDVGVKKRISSVVNYRAPASWVVTFAVIISVIASVCLLTDPVSAVDYDNFVSDEIKVEEEFLQPQVSAAVQKYTYGNEDVLLINVKNNSDVNRSVTVNVSCYGKNGCLIMNNVQTIPSVAACSDSYFILRSKIKISDVSYNVSSEISYGEPPDISFDNVSFYVIDDRVMDIQQRMVVFNGASGDVDTYCSVTAVVFDHSGNIIDIIGKDKISFNAEKGENLSLSHFIDKDIFLDDKGEYKYSQAYVVDLYEWKTAANAIYILGEPIE